MGNLTRTLSHSAHALYATETNGPRTSSKKKFVHAVTEENIRINEANVLEAVSISSFVCITIV
jgi:hypothetical protein